MDKEQHALQKPVIVQLLQKPYGLANLDQQEAGCKNIVVSRESNLGNTYFVHGKGGQMIGKHLAEAGTKGFSEK